ncbi:MAG: EF-hand domain-containing protein [Planctomycetes bacterium]|nr:EF-hand domain-containing protein [Planctomycetota bacterium]
MHRFIRPVVMVMLATVSLPAFAQDKKAPDPEKTFKRKDSNGDGFLSLDEFKAKLKDKQLENADRRFGRLDTNADKKVSLEEFKAGIKPKP